jgi:hypothetical protein
MVEVQLAKLKEETRCPMCFGESFGMRNVTFSALSTAAEAMVVLAAAVSPARGGGSNTPPDNSRTKHYVCEIVSGNGMVIGVRHTQQCTCLPHP